ncbi:MAG TPA: glycerol-3-phosphate responsive antiterminator [Feifaniaceae bacterium]|nr:glycerol-3-phosphate responsive antiterminator [Feifaniaceae bacterium]
MDKRLKGHTDMNTPDFFDQLDDCPVIASVKDAEGLETALKSKSRVIFTLYGDVLNISQITRRIKDAGKLPFVHIDLVEGLSARDISADYIASYTSAEGIISTKSNLIGRASELGLLSIQRCFLLDSLALSNIVRQSAKSSACAIEVLPGPMPKVLSRITGTVSMPVIAGGLISDKEDVMHILGAGARAVSSTNPEIWFL